MKKNLIILLCLSLLLSFTACGKKDETPAGTEKPAAASAQEPAGGVIDLCGNSISAAAGGVTVNGRIATITAGGEYTMRGTLENGQIIVNAPDDARVLLHLDGVALSNAEAPCIYVQQADKLKLILDEGSENSMISGVEGELKPAAEDANGGVIFSEEDLDFEGSGKLTLKGYINNGVTCKDDLAVQGGDIVVLAANNGLRGSESVEIEAGKLSINALGDGIKSTSSKKENKGYVSVSGGEVAIESVGDGVSAETQLLVSGGSVSVKTSGDPELVSSKGLRGKTGVLISGGSLKLDTTDHAIRSGGELQIKGGELDVKSSMGRGISAAGSVTISEGSFLVNAIEDGIYSETDLTIEAGTFSIAAGEDGLHAGKSGNGAGRITISGGSILISAYQDGIDAKQELLINGGNVLACGKSKVLKTPSSQSAQKSICREFSGHANSELLITNADGEMAGQLNAVYPFTSVLFSRAGLNQCTLSCDGASITATP